MRQIALFFLSLENQLTCDLLPPQKNKIKQDECYHSSNCHVKHKLFDTLYVHSVPEKKCGWKKS